MYLSKLILNTHNAIGLRSLIDPYETHRTVWRGFPDKEDGGPDRVLFRVEEIETDHPVVILVQSRIEPDWQPLLNEGVLRSAQHKEICVSSIHFGQLLWFRLKANPTARKIVDETIRDEDGRPKRGRVGLFRDEQQMDWLRDKAKKCGFRLAEYRIRGKEHLNSSKPGNKGKMTHLGVTFEGILEVTEPELFLKTLESGIGSAKGFGFGLLSIAPSR